MVAWDFQPSLDFESIYSLEGTFIGIANPKAGFGCSAAGK